ncbi:MAG: glycine cleavage system protein H [Ignavibacteriae bacterium]|nr:MAG: glycine cleavage system protein H [Ignavibacteriota bacterium]
MFPWVYGFAWTPGNIIFLGIFFSVVAIIGATVLISLFRTYRALQVNKTEAIRWDSEFHDLPATSRKCRHELSGEFKQRTCDNGFDCRTCATHAKLIQNKTLNSDDIELPIQLFGFTIPTDRLYHRGHTWVKSDASGIYTVGLDDFASRMVGTPDGIELPAIGSRVQVNGSAWRFKKGESVMRILSPLDGEVVAASDGSDGWYLKIKPLTKEVDTRHLLRDREVAAWFLREFEQLQEKLADPKVGLTLADGGTPVQDFVKAYPGVNWDGILGDVFLEA